MLYSIIIFLGTIDNLIEYIFITLTFFFLYIYLIGLPIFATFIKLIINVIGSKSNIKTGGELGNLLSTKDGFELIYEACQMEYSLENLACWKDIEDYYKESSFENRKEKYLRIYNLYLNGNYSEMELNVPSEILKQIKEKVENGLYDEDLFKDLKAQVYRSLSDTFIRLYSTEQYKSFKKRKQLMKDVNME